MCASARAQQVTGKGDRPARAGNSAASRAMRSHAPLGGRRFFLDVRGAAAAGTLSTRLRARGATVELFFGEAVTHVITDDVKFIERSKLKLGANRECNTKGARSLVHGKLFSGQCGLGYKSRANAMLESVYNTQREQSSSILQQAQLWNIPVWTVKKVERLLNEIDEVIHRNVEVKTFKGPFIKFESLDRKNRAVYKEFTEWPQLNLTKKHRGSPFTHLKLKIDVCINNEPKYTDRELSIKRNSKTNANGYTGTQIPDSCLRMTRRTKIQARERTEAKQNRYCEICCTTYTVLSEHERTFTHINFVKDCSNFLSLDSLINENNDVDTFIKMNKSVTNICERRSLRNTIKGQTDIESQQTLQKQFHVICNGGSDEIFKQMSPRECKRLNNLNEQPASFIFESGHNLRSKGNATIDNDTIKFSPKESRREFLRNGSLSPRVSDKYGLSTKVNGKIEEKRYASSSLMRTRRVKGIRWQRPNLNCNSSSPDNQTYYKVVGMSTKLRSSNNNTSYVQKDIEPVCAPPPRSHYNGNSDTSLVVKFRRVRRSELSVLSDEAENFMFPKKDDSESTDNENETSHYSHNVMSDTLNSNNGLTCKVKEEVLSGDDISQDSCGSDNMYRKCKRRRTDTYNKEISKSETTTSRRRQRSMSKSSDICNSSKMEAVKDLDAANIEQENLVQREKKCLTWEDGKLKTPPEVDNLTFTFEKVPVHEPWYDTYKRQDDGKEKSCDIASYLGYYWRSPILPYEMGQLPPMKSNCCSLNLVKKAIEEKSKPSRSYGTRGMKKKKIKLETSTSLSRNPRKSPREHASTLAILGSLVHKKRSKLSSSDDSKSLPSIAEEDTSSDTPLLFRLPEIQVSESSKKLEDFFSSVSDNDEYDTIVENLDNSIYIDKISEKPNIEELLKNYNECETIENIVKEMQNNINQIGEVQKKRRGYKFKKKNNRTGWPAKKRTQVKKETTSTAGSGTSSREASVNREAILNQESVSLMSKEASICDKVNKYVSETCNENNKSQIVNVNLVLENNENSITSLSDIDDKVLNSSKCKSVIDTECSNSEEEIPLSAKKWVSLDQGFSDKSNSEGEKHLQHSSHSNNKGLQPVVRVQKIETKAPQLRGNRKLRKKYRRKHKGQACR